MGAGSQRVTRTGPAGGGDAGPGVLEYETIGRQQMQPFGRQQVDFRIGFATGHPVPADDAGEIVRDTAVAEDEIDVFAAARRTDGAGDASATQLFEQVHKPPYGADFRSIDFAVDGLFLLAERFQALFAYDFFGQDLAHDIVVAHAEGGLKLPLPLFDAVTLAEYFECPDMRPGVVHQYAVHIE